MLSWLKKIFKKKNVAESEIEDKPLPEDVIELVHGVETADINKDDLFIFCNSQGNFVSSSVSKYLGMWKNGEHGYSTGREKGFSEPTEMADSKFIKKLRKSAEGEIYIRVSDRTAWLVKNRIDGYTKLIEASYYPKPLCIYRLELAATEKDLELPSKWERYEAVSVCPATLIRREIK
jgi:hypothetical protein